MAGSSAFGSGVEVVFQRVGGSVQDHPVDFDAAPVGREGEPGCVVHNPTLFWQGKIARLVGVRVPIVPMSHQYVVTEAMFEHRETPLPS